MFHSPLGQLDLVKRLVFLLVLLHLSSCGQFEVVSADKRKAIDVDLKPNMLFIYTDDQAPWAIGSSGNAQAITPNMDALANAGMRFPNAYTTTPVCSPSRAGLLTSKYGFELGIDDWINTHYKPAALSGLEPELGLPQSETTWPELLQQSGYYTGLIGKWHLGIEPRFHPRMHGYSEFSGFIKGGTKTVDPVLEVNGQEVNTQGLTADILTDYAVDFLNRHQSRPFALSLHYRAPHTRWLPVAPEDAAPYLDMEMILPDPDFPGLDVEKNQRFMKEYLSSVRSVDRNIGRLISELKQLKLWHNTLLVFTSDHGYNMGHNGIWHKGNGHWLLKNKVPAQSANIPVNQRPNMYDNSIKVPTLVVWPGKVAANSVNLSTLSNLDWFPTLIEVAGVQTEGLSLRGQSKLPALLDPNLTQSTDYFAAYTTKHQSRSGMRMYSDGRYKLVRDFINQGRDELYHLTRDPKESTNLINDNDAELQAIKQRLNQALLSKMAELDDPLLQRHITAAN